MLSFQRLEVYQRSIEFFTLTLEIIAVVPKGHADIADQLRRAAQSQPLNIAEAAGRTGRAASHRYDRGVDLLTSIVAMLTKLIQL